MSHTPPPRDDWFPRDLPRDPEATYDPTESYWLHEVPSDVIDSNVPTVDRDRQERVPAGTGAIVETGGRPAGDTADKDRFILRRRIAEGGFGDVWEAVQTSLGRTVAVKRLRDFDPTDLTPEPSMDPGELERVFRHEAMIAAQLEHPNILPVYDLGADAAGRPLLAMKLVKGRPWSVLIRDDFERLQVHEFLGRHLPILISVSQAVAFAHSHGIVHRDLKPSQVMIGRFGEVLLMDWGLAMAYSPDGSRLPNVRGLPDPTSPLYNPSNPAGTPAYMAPEQTEPDARNLGPWTDIYLLGAMLYKLLTGHAPHKALTSEMTYRRARQGDYNPPELQALDREVPPQLSMIARKAMERLPGDRYASAEEFLTAIQDYLIGSDQLRESVHLSTQVSEMLAASPNDYEVLAQCLNLLDRSLMLWPANQLASQRRQKVLAQYARTAIDSRDLKLARVQAERMDLGASRELLVKKISGLEDEQRRQEERLAEALAQAKSDRDRAEELVRFLLGDLYQELKPAGRLGTLHRVIAASVRYFDSLETSEATDETLYNRCVAYLNIGDVFCDEGRKAEAEDAFRKARAIADQLAHHNQTNVDWMLALADSYERIAKLHYYAGRTAESRQDHIRALEIRQQLALLRSNDTRVEAGMASSRHNLGIIAWRQQDLVTALEYQLDSLSQYRRLLDANPGTPELEAALAWNLSTLGNVFRDHGDLDRAIEVTREALAIRQDLAEQQPGNAPRTEDMLWTHGNLALLLLMRGDLEESLEMFEKDLAHHRRLAQEEPANVVRAGALTFPLSLIAEIQYMLHQVSLAEATIRECIEITRGIVARDPDSTHMMAAYARQVGQLAECLLAQGRFDDAAPAAEFAFDTVREAVTHSPRSGMCIKVLARTSLLRAYLFARKGDHAMAEQLCREAAQTLDTLRTDREELDIVELTALIAILEDRPDDAAERLRNLRKRRWLSPLLEAICRERGVSLPG